MGKTSIGLIDGNIPSSLVNAIYYPSTSSGNAEAIKFRS